ENANVVTAIKLPEGIDGAAVPKTMRDRFGVTIAGGQGRLKGKIARIAHCGYFSAFDITTTFAAFEMALREAGHDVELGAGVDAGLIEKATRLRAIGRAGVGVDNVDVEAATKRGIVVVNAPQSNVITAAEHTMALLLALARNVPQAHASLTGGAWERSSFSGVELHEKTLGILGFGRIGQLVAQRARGFGMHVVGFDLYVAEERFRELGVERAVSSDDLYAVADFITIHL